MTENDSHAIDGQRHEGDGPSLVKASLTNLRNLEHIDVDWNPQSYSVSRQARFAVAGGIGAGRSALQHAAGGDETFSTELFFDSSRLTVAAEETTSEAGGSPVRRLREKVERLERWMDPEPGTGLPPPLVFVWGSFRFRGVVESLEQVWVRFDASGEPTRGHVRLRMRRGA